MIEPLFFTKPNLALPFSQLPRSDLEAIARGEVEVDECYCDEDCDVDFAICYARKLLAERT